jgi:hypothetical protein
MTEPTRSRAVFSTEDFKLIKKAVAFYVRENQDDEDSSKYSNLYHRIGRLGGSGSR